MKLTELSYIEISSDIVKKQCEAKIKQIDDDRSKSWEESIGLYIESYNNGWWNKFRNRKATRELAEKHLKDDDDLGFSTYFWTTLECKEQRDICNSILRLCKNNATIRLTAIDARWIGL